MRTKKTAKGGRQGWLTVLMPLQTALLLAELVARRLQRRG